MMRDHRDLDGDGTSRHSKLASRRSKGSQLKKSHKASRLSLSSELSSSEDVPKELAGISSLSEPLDAHPDGEVTEITDDSADIPIESSRSSNSTIATLGVDEPGILLITAQRQVMESLDANCQSAKLLEKLIKDNIDKYSHASQEKAHTDGPISGKARISLCLVLVIILIIVFSSGPERTNVGILPT
ncbi:hypothetical protein SAY86_021891 [Trapa natans]|uniref:Uncharacterized protein n=1 Tax=Trapa natans TaxID=22666 RepID=A0AAN7MAI5_TRANT|nr:hypothetical protein SAY86_021891 [Trapa natans]